MSLVILVKKEELIDLLKEELRAWEVVGGGPNFKAAEYDIDSMDTQQLKELGYYKNPDSWIAGIRYLKIKQYLDNIDTFPPSAKSSIL